MFLLVDMCEISHNKELCEISRNKEFKNKYIFGIYNTDGIEDH